MAEQKNIAWPSVWRYLVLPQLKPRIQALISSGFQYVAFFIALVYQIVRLLPANHPYSNAANIGRFGIRHVIAEAANHLSFNVKNIDQVIIFSLIMIGMLIVLVQICTLLLSIAFAPVMAQVPTDFTAFFTTADPSQDLAFMLMDLVFGIPGIFDSCIATGQTCLDLNNSEIAKDAAHQAGTFLGGINEGATIPFPVHTGLHNMFKVYSYGLLVVAVFITIYFIFVVFAETAQSGTPFGKRFNKVWAPIRMVVAFGLLIPIGGQNGPGLNSSQYIVLYAAKFGSSFATNGWLLFNETLSTTYAGEVEELVAKPEPPELGSLMQFVFVAKTCAEYYKAKDGTSIEPYLVRTQFSATPNLKVDFSTTHKELVNFADRDATLTIRFGREDKKDYALYKGFIKPLCGEMEFTLNDGRAFSIVNGSQHMEQAYWKMFMDAYFHWFKEDQNYPENFINTYSIHGDYSGPALLNDEFFSKIKQRTLSALNDAIDKAIETEKKSGRWKENLDRLKKSGWGGGGIWYNRIAETNGVLTTAILNVPTPSLYPSVMEHVRQIKLQTDNNVLNAERYDPALANGQFAEGINSDDGNMGRTLYKAFAEWEKGGKVMSTHTAPSGNMIMDIINGVFGTQGLFNMRENTDIHPLAQLSAVGRALIESVVQNIGLAVIGGISGVLAGALDQFAFAGTASVAAGFLVSIATIAMTIGFVLFYVVPFLPFIYFFFAVSGWVKGIFEAMVGAPLWALAHIRIDGDGLAGQAAVSGYFLIFEIFLRPILIVFGLLASISIFSAMVKALNEIFSLVVENLTGFAGGNSDNGEISMEMLRGPLDEFMFTIIYAVIVYLMGMSSFKLIDHIPNQIMRWMGQGITTFNDARADPAESLMGTAWFGGQQTFGALGGGLSKGLGGIRGNG